MWGKNRKDDWTYHYRNTPSSQIFLCGQPVGDCAVMPDKSPGRYCPTCNKLFSSTRTPASSTSSSSTQIGNGVAAHGNIGTTPQHLSVNTPPLSSFLDSVHRYAGKQTPEQMLTYDFEIYHLKLVMSRKDKSILSLRQERTKAKTPKNYQHVSEQKFVLEDTALQLEALHRMEEQPYFGRIDFAVDDYDSSDALYIGRCTLKDANGKFLVYDWRNPVGAMFYQHRPGRAYYKAPTSSIKGDMLLKRQFSDTEITSLSFTDEERISVEQSSKVGLPSASLTELLC